MIYLDLKNIVIENISYIADRFERQPEYPWIDTKFDVITGRDFPEEDIIRSRNTVYSWIQGRGLESLVGHACWLKGLNKPEADHLAERLTNITRMVYEKLFYVWQLNNYHFFFYMSPEGTPIEIDIQKKIIKQKTLIKDSPYNFSDLFCSKGLYAAARFLKNDISKITLLREYCGNVYNSIMSGQFISDQQQLDSKNPVAPVAGRYSHGPMMIQIGAVALLAMHEKSSDAVEMGLSLIEKILNNYVNINDRWPDLRLYDFVEFIDKQGNPYLQDGHILSDPGHALEFIGLSLKFMDIIGKLNIASVKQLNRLQEAKLTMPLIFKQNYRNGLSSDVDGICKLFSLSHRKAVNSDMPWWSLAETIRAAAYCLKLTNDSYFLDVIKSCHHSFMKKYVRKDRHYFQYQTLGIDSKPVYSIPAMPDVDPGYHTGLSLIDTLAIHESYIN